MALDPKLYNAGGGVIDPYRSTFDTSPNAGNKTDIRADGSYLKINNNNTPVTFLNGQQQNAGGGTINPYNVTASSAPIIQAETNTTNTINGLTATAPGFDTTDLDRAYKSQQQLIKDRQAQLDAEYKDDIAGLNAQFNETRAKAEDGQMRETATTNVALQRIGGYLGTQMSAVGALNNLQSAHRSEITTLEAKRAAALQAARTAKNADDFKLAQALADSVKGLDEEIYKRKNNFFDQALKLTQEQRQQDQDKMSAATSQENARLSAINQLRDDARSSLSTIISQFGGIDTRNMDKETMSYVSELASLAGIPIGSIQGPTLSQQNQVSVAKQREVSNSIARAGLSIRQKSFNLQQQISGSEAKAQGLPRSLVGRTEQQVSQDLSSRTVPEWWIESQYPNGLANGQTKEIQTKWNTFRTEVIKTSSLIDFGGMGNFSSFNDTGDQPAITD